VDTSTDVIVSGNTITNVMGSGTTGHGMYVSGSSVGVQVLDNVLHDNAYVGLHVNGDVSEGLPGVVKNLLVAGNLIYKNGQNGINCDGIESSTFENNVIYGNARNGIELYQIDAYGGSTSNAIVNTTIDQSMVAGSYAIAIAQCQYDNQSAEPTPASVRQLTHERRNGCGRLRSGKPRYVGMIRGGPNQKMPGTCAPMGVPPAPGAIATLMPSRLTTSPRRPTVSGHFAMRSSTTTGISRAVRFAYCS
jgi:hypothetical protein